MNYINKPDLQNIGNSGEYCIAAILSANGYTTTITLGRAEKYDILAVNQKNGKVIKIQVKTGWYRKNSVWRLGEKCEAIFADDFYYAFVNLNELKEPIEYWLVPSELVAKTIKESHKIWLSLPGKNGQKHNDNPGRTFSVKPVNYAPKWLDFEEINSYKNNLSAIKK
jgi:hypothetical protein